MSSGTFTLFSKNKADLRLNDLLGATVKLALVTSAYTPDASVTGHSLWSEISANEISAAGQAGYSAGGQTLSSLAVTAITNGYKFTSSNPQWTAAGGPIPAHRYYVMYVLGTLWSKTNPVIGYFVGDAAPADIPATTVPNTLTATVPAGGFWDAV